MNTIYLITKSLLICGLSPNLRGASCKRILKRWWCVTAVLVIGGLITPVDYAHALDALGRNVSGVSLRLLPCETLELAELKRSIDFEPVRFRIAGILTKYESQDYLLLQKATQTYSHGNFGR